MYIHTTLQPFLNVYLKHSVASIFIKSILQSVHIILKNIDKIDMSEKLKTLLPWGG